MRYLFKGENVMIFHDKIDKTEGKIEGREKCVLCSEDTRYIKNMPVDMRSCYVMGVGQLCSGCWHKTYASS